MRAVLARARQVDLTPPAADEWPVFGNGDDPMPEILTATEAVEAIDQPDVLVLILGRFAFAFRDSKGEIRIGLTQKGIDKAKSRTVRS
jgi:hypothetical protein